MNEINLPRRSFLAGTLRLAGPQATVKREPWEYRHENEANYRPPVAAAGVVVSIYYYFGWIRAAFFASGDGPGEGRPARTPVGWAMTVALGGLALASVLLGFYQGPFGHWLVW